MATQQKQPQMFDVPNGTQRQQCRSCKAPVYWIVTAKGSRMPVDCAVEGGYEPSGDAAMGTNGRGASHFVTCPDRDQWRKR